MAHPATSPVLESLRSACALRLVLALTTLVWFVSADACALSDVQLDCAYGAAGFQHAVDGEPDSNGSHDDAKKGVHCPHSVSVQLPVIYRIAAPITLERGADGVFHAPQSFHPVDAPPPTPPPI